jgi:hypothetical protein
MGVAPSRGDAPQAQEHEQNSNSGRNLLVLAGYKRLLGVMFVVVSRGGGKRTRAGEALCRPRGVGVHDRCPSPCSARMPCSAPNSIAMEHGDAHEEGQELERPRGQQDTTVEPMEG